MALQDGITNDWGGKPYNDLVNCFEYIEGNLPYVDTQNAVALGASYGGFMISKTRPFLFVDVTDTFWSDWIQGHPLGRKFKALVCHDGVYSTMNMYCTEELFFPCHDFGGSFFENREGYVKWDPAAHINEWETPELVSPCTQSHVEFLPG